ncbi:SNF2-related protein [Gayadomonas joobiniege]|uniref:DEAD/DEAH box helicase n=1 Tax=Gayadomonas joobiniege TaxID=1234606 RepID=UPI00036F17DA|nr:SNF2-related protein [Gayadomonas joobiniege]
MSVQDAELAEQFGENTYQKGLDLYLADQVKKLKSIDSLDTVTAVVEARNQQYRVAIDKSDFSSLCTCTNSGKCEHAVATLIAAEAKNLIDRTPVSAFAQWQKSADDLTQKLSQKSNQLAVSTASSMRFVLQPVVEPVSGFTQMQIQLIADPGASGMQKTLSRTIQQRLNAQTQLPSRSQRLLTRQLDSKVLSDLANSGLCFWHAENKKALSLGESVTLNIDWQAQKERFKLQLSLKSLRRWFLIATEHPWYIDSETLTMGPIASELSGRDICQLLHLPALDQKDLLEFASWQQTHLSELTLDLPLEKSIVRIQDKLTPVLRIGLNTQGYVARLRLKYQNHEIPMSLVNEPFVQLEKSDHIVQIQRDPAAERKAFYLLDSYGFAHTKSGQLSKDFEFFYNTEIGVRYDQFWVNIFDEILPLLNSMGWQVEFEQGVKPIQVVNDPEFDIKIDETQDWFKISVSLTIDNEEIDLIPILVNWLKQTENWRSLKGRVKLALSRHQYIRVKLEKLFPILNLLEESGNRQARFSTRQAHVLNQIPDINECIGGQHVKRLATLLKNFDGIEEIELPNSLNAKLRPYQQQGVNWLNFLVCYKFGGILADDMGLGKTLQALSLLDFLRANGQLHKTALIICPTSLVGNWISEAQKFAPALKIAPAQGTQRQDILDTMAEYDVIVSTYPLVNRDFAFLYEQDFSLIILDEAQNIKNPRAQMTQNIKQLTADHKICLSGTPIENHLGELWSLFDFLMPGFLGNQHKFSREYRKPIENQQDKEAQTRLLHKITPFVLRRRKEEVAKELPQKTEIIKRIELDETQRTLYEAIRSSMEDKVRSILQLKGLAKSQLECLDALLKLRQICCAPELLNFTVSEEAKHSAKLEYLMDIVPEMIEEGRRILIFSQFSKMLGVIERRFKKINLPYAKLTGETRDRQSQIDSFQNCEVPVFLISLKAGGTGLNLTAADTVIHYDPWWNPAAEAQASDRAYRIGQTKPVFVYKLICQNTIEEKVLHMQQNKKDLNENLFNKDKQDGLSDMSADDLLELFKTA